jgi:histidinol-phosphate aminotransferase
MRFNPVLERLKPYRAGPSLEDIRNRYGLDQVAIMSANEVPWGPFPEVAEALKAAVDHLNRYPDGRCGPLRTLLAERLSVSEDQLAFGNGSCELLMLLAQALIGPERHVVFPHPSFVMYRSIAMAEGSPFAAVPLKELEYDLEAMQNAVRPETTMLIICNPNNPTGTYLAPTAVRRFLAKIPDDVVVVLDEAYGEFVTSPAHQETAGWVSEFPNLVVLRTFSKIYGLAGLRLGYGIADAAIVSALDKIRQPFNVDSLAQVAALESLRHSDRLAERRDRIAVERGRLVKLLGEMGISCHPSEANFLLVDVTGLGVPGPEVPQALLEMGILTRSGYAMGCPGWIRVTIGEAADGDLFLAAMRELSRGAMRAREAGMDTAIDADSLSPES